MESQLLPWAGTLRAQWRQVPVRHRGLDGWRIIITVEHLTGELPTPPEAESLANDSRTSYVNKRRPTPTTHTNHRILQGSHRLRREALHPLGNRT